MKTSNKLLSILLIGLCIFIIGCGGIKGQKVSNDNKIKVLSDVYKSDLTPQEKDLFEKRIADDFKEGTSVQELINEQYDREKKRAASNSLPINWDDTKNEPIIDEKYMINAGLTSNERRLLSRFLQTSKKHNVAFTTDIKDKTFGQLIDLAVNSEIAYNNLLINLNYVKTEILPFSKKYRIDFGINFKDPSNIGIAHLWYISRITYSDESTSISSARPIVRYKIRNEVNTGYFGKVRGNQYYYEDIIDLPANTKKIPVKLEIFRPWFVGFENGMYYEDVNIIRKPRHNNFTFRDEADYEIKNTPPIFTVDLTWHNPNGNIGNYSSHNNTSSKFSDSVKILDYVNLGEIVGFSTKGELPAPNWRVTNSNIDPTKDDTVWVFDKDVLTGKKSNVGGLVFNFRYFNRPSYKVREIISVKTTDGIEIPVSPVGTHYIFRTDNGCKLYINPTDYRLNALCIDQSNNVSNIITDNVHREIINNLKLPENVGIMFLENKVTPNNHYIDIEYRNKGLINNQKQAFHLLRIGWDSTSQKFVAKIIS